MSTLKRDNFGNVIMPNFPHLQGQLNAARQELDWLNNSVLPKIREHGFTSGRGLTGKLILSATIFPDFMPDVPKRDLRFGKYMRFNGTKMSFNREDFMFDYDLTQEGMNRIEAIREFEKLSDEERNSCLIQR